MDTFLMSEQFDYLLIEIAHCAMLVDITQIMPHVITQICAFVLSYCYGRPIFLPCSFYLLSSSIFLFFIPRLISAAADWMSTILLHMAWP